MKLLILMFLSLSVFAGSSERIAYQGRLIQANGAPIAGPIDLDFKLYKNADATVQCVESISAVPVSQGIFAVELTFPALCNGGKTFKQFLVETANAGDMVYLEITDSTNAKTYAKQAMTAATYSYVSLQLAGSIDATQVGGGNVDNTEFSYLNGVTSSIQSQLDGKQAAGNYQPLDADLTDLADGSLTGSKVGTGISATNMTSGSLNAVRIGTGAVDNTEFSHLNGVTSSIQTQLNSKQASGSYLTTTGGTMSGAIVMGGNKITGLAAPTVLTDATSKSYVDAATVDTVCTTFKGASCPAGWTREGDGIGAYSQRTTCNYIAGTTTLSLVDYPEACPVKLNLSLLKAYGSGFSAFVQQVEGSYYCGYYSRDELMDNGYYYNASFTYWNSDCSSTSGYHSCKEAPLENNCSYPMGTGNIITSASSGKVHIYDLNRFVLSTQVTTLVEGVAASVCCRTF